VKLPEGFLPKYTLPAHFKCNIIKNTSEVRNETSYENHQLKLEGFTIKEVVCFFDRKFPLSRVDLKEDWLSDKVVDVTIEQLNSNGYNFF